MARVFVTVGTWKFEDLVKTVTEENFLKLLQQSGYSNITVQLGRGEYEPTDASVDGMTVEWFRLKPSLHHDMSSASLIISHGGAGCIQEALALEKPLIVVINEGLMDNHQMELATQLANDGHLLYTTCNKLYHTVQSLDTTSLVPYRRGNSKLFGDLLDSVMGFTDND